MIVDVYRLLCCILLTVTTQQYVSNTSGLSVSALDVDKRRFTGYGTYIANMTANSKLPKYAKVDAKMKQRVLAHFFKVEGLNKTEIARRLSLRFGGKTINLDEKETSEELEKRRSLHYNVVERIIIQFLNAERVRPADIFKRLRRVSDHGQHWCNVYRWVYKFRRGRTEVANIPCLKTTKPKVKISSNSSRTFNLSKCATVTTQMKLKVLVDFLKGENISESEISGRLRNQYGNESVNLEEIHGVMNTCVIHPSVRERIIIQFLYGEGVRPLDIAKCLLKRNMMKDRHLSYVYRWVDKFRQGRTDVENKHWTKMRKKQDTDIAIGSE